MNQNYFVHPKAIVESHDIGEGTRIWAFAHVLPGARIGRHCNVGDHCFIEGKVVVGDYCTIKNGVSLWDLVTLEDGVFVGPNAVFTNDMRPRAFPDFRATPEEWLPTLVREGAAIGANATIVCGTTIGRYAFVGAGSVVTKDVVDHGLVVGIPARRVGYVCRCGRRVQPERPCTCGRCYRVTDGRLVEAPAA
jgi:UDP-2-acetamido-3-amino-2,3-dideoxy-glucuronate N-acetyltransferase